MDRDAQFHYINDQAINFLTAGDPVISVDTKKKELVGDFKNQAANGAPKAHLKRSRFMISLTPS